MTIDRIRKVADSARTRLAKGESGLSLVELLVSISLGTLVLALVVGMFVAMQNVVNLSGAINDSTKASSLAMNEVSTVLRFATPNPKQGLAPDPAFVAASNESVTVYAYVDSSAASPQPYKVTLSLDSSRRLVETRYASYSVAPGYWAFYSAVKSSQILTGAIVSPTGAQPYLFTYLDASNAVIPMGGTGLTATQLGQVASVKVTIKVATTSRGNPVILQNTVGLPNLGINRTGQDTYGN